MEGSYKKDYDSGMMTSNTKVYSMSDYLDEKPKPGTLYPYMCIYCKREQMTSKLGNCCQEKSCKAAWTEEHYGK